MLVTTRLAMPTTLQSHVSQEGTVQKQLCAFAAHHVRVIIIVPRRWWVYRLSVGKSMPQHKPVRWSAQGESSLKWLNVVSILSSCVYIYKYCNLSQYTPSNMLHSCTCYVQCTGLKVVEVAHDYQPQVQKYVVDELKLLNSYDTWHGKTKQYTNYMLQ